MKQVLVFRFASAKPNNICYTDLVEKSKHKTTAKHTAKKIAIEAAGIFK